jgi:small subunit ribosomal protein S8
MSMTDPIADLLTRIRNAQSAGKPTVGVGASKLKVAILKVLKEEGYIGAYGVEVSGAKSTLSIELKYHDGRPVIDRIERISRPGLRIIAARTNYPRCSAA